jgi:hypothetical protein
MNRNQPYKPGDRVTVRTGMHTKACGEVIRREGSAWIVRLDSGTTRQFVGTSLQKMANSPRRVQS